MTHRRSPQRFNWIGWNILLWGGLLFAAVVAQLYNLITGT